MELKGICNYETRCTLFAVLLLHDHTCLFRVHQKKHRLFGFSSCPDRANGKKRPKKSASFAIWGLPHVQASLEEAEHHSTLFLCFAAYLWAVFGPIFGNSSLMSLQGRTLGMLAVCCRHSTKVNKATQMFKCFTDSKTALYF